MELKMQTFDIGLQIEFITVRAKINILHRLVDHTFSSEQSHVKVVGFGQRSSSAERG